MAESFELNWRGKEVAKNVKKKVKARVDGYVQSAIVPAIRANAPKDTGAMAESVRFEPFPNNVGGKIQADNPAWYHENGATSTPASRFMSDAVKEHHKGILNAVKGAV